MSEEAQTIPVNSKEEQTMQIMLKDGISVDLPINQIKRCKTFDNLLDDIEGDEDSPLPAENISLEIFELISKFMELHPIEEDIKYLTEEGQKELRVKMFEKKDIELFKKMEQKTIFDIILIANYLDFKLLLDYSCKFIADMIKGKKPDEIKKIFGVEGDFTKEEKENVLKENPWLEDSTPMETQQDGATSGGGAADESTGGGGAAE